MVDVGPAPDLIGYPAHRLSGGQLPRVCIAPASAPRPRSLLLDEAVGSWHAETQAGKRALLREPERSAGMSFRFATHNLRLVRGFVDRRSAREDHRRIEVPDGFGRGPVPPILAALRDAILPMQPGLSASGP
jgi:nickel transport system ATP-binding protein